MDGLLLRRYQAGNSWTLEHSAQVTKLGGGFASATAAQGTRGHRPTGPPRRPLEYGHKASGRKAAAGGQSDDWEVCASNRRGFS
jgi:hypothetical protein